MSDEQKQPGAAGEADEHDASSWAELLRKAAYLGIGTAFATQETARSVLRDMKLPREVVSMIMQNFEKNREEMVNVAQRTLSDYLQNLDVAHLLKNAMDGMKLTVTGEVQFNYDPSRKGKLDADVKLRARPKRGRRRKKGDDA
ncbi:MAG: hypothetical protein D6761_01330 [Candidatus Dadabacteria bacterium]|nr:MAG: hypothetical protein D6761_01330 [Candidatus Dadabacteria bacterium]